MPKVTELKETLLRANATWHVARTLKDEEEFPRFGLGGSPQGLVLADRAPRLDFREILRDAPANPLLADRLRVVMPHLPREAHPSVPPAGGGARPTSVDWRSRWGTAWITTIRDQDGCNACWAFTGTALIEAMVRIEHAVWPILSEGDVHKGMGALCPHEGNIDAVSDWVSRNGIADPGCFAWTTADVAYTPTPDRAGRTVRAPKGTRVGSVEEQKTWLDTIGPLGTWFMVWDDFRAYGGGIYQRQDRIGTQPNRQAGGHFMLVVGYNDTDRCWIVKNSWGRGWGEGGYGRIAYGQCEIDRYAKLGLRGTNPDPWTKRRLHGGNVIESGNGATHRNFEMLATANGTEIRHWWRQGGEGGDFGWRQAATFGNDAAACPTMTATTYNRNFESVHLTTGRRLHHWWFDQASGQWRDGGIFGPQDADGIPGFIQSDYGAPGNFEVVVRTADHRLNHWWRDRAGWHDGGRFASNVAASGAALVQTRTRNLEAVCVLRTGEMQVWWRDDARGLSWTEGPRFGAGVTSPPCMIEGQYGAADETRAGNYELCVAVGGRAQHWWRDNQGSGIWRNSATFGHDVAAVAGLVEGSFGFNLEVVVLRTDRQLQHYVRDGAGWHEGPIIGTA